MLRRTGKTLVLVLTLFILPLGATGCISGMLNCSAGGEKVWWCDKCQTRVGGMDSHVCGLTKYNPETGKDEPLDGVTEEMLREAKGDYELTGANSENTNPRIAEMEKERREDSKGNDGKPWWKFWKR